MRIRSNRFGRGPGTGGCEERLLRFARDACCRHARLGKKAEFFVCRESRCHRCRILHCRVEGGAGGISYVVKWRLNPGRWNVAHEYESLRHLHVLSRQATIFSVSEPVAYNVSPPALLTVKADGELAHQSVRQACRRTASAADRQKVRTVLNRAAVWLSELQELTRVALSPDEARASQERLFEEWHLLFEEAVAERLSLNVVGRITDLARSLLEAQARCLWTSEVHGDFGLGQLLVCSDGTLRGLDFELHERALISPDAGQQRITLERMAANPWWSRRALEELWGCFLEALTQRGISPALLLLGYLKALPPRMKDAPALARPGPVALARYWRHRRWLHGRWLWLERLADCRDPNAAYDLFAKRL